MWLAVRLIPAVAPVCRTAKLNSGVGRGSAKTSASHPSSVITLADKSANSGEKYRVS